MKPQPLDPSETDPTTLVLLRKAAEGDLDARDRAWECVFDEVLRVAAAQRRRWSGDWTLETGVLANEVFVKLYGGEAAATPNDRKHFFVMVSRAIRQVLLNYSEYKSAAKRGGGATDHTLIEGLEHPLTSGAQSKVRELHDALERFSSLDPRAAQVVELRFFAGLNYVEIAETLDISRATAVRDWEAAKAWLNRALDDTGADAG